MNLGPDQGKLAKKARRIFQLRGKPAVIISKNTLAKKRISYTPLRNAVEYFSDQLHLGAQFPAIMSLACEAAGGKPEQTTKIGASLLLLAGAADVHDDIIDASVSKNHKPTVLGRFGRDVAVLVGDVLLEAGFMLLFEAVQELSHLKQEKIRQLTESAFLDLCCGEAQERHLWELESQSLKDCLEAIEMKASAMQYHAEIGGVVAGAGPETIAVLGNYGKSLAVLAAIREEFVDMFEPDELKNRYSNELLPLPVLCAMKNAKVKNTVIKTLRKEQLTNEDANSIVELVWDSKDLCALRDYMQTVTKTAFDCLKELNMKLRSELELWVNSTIEDLE